MKPQFTFHLIPNAHLDPVWLWDWREGLNEGLVTCRTILDLMDEDRELTFIRGETFIYEHIERTDPATFARIRKYVKQGRWDPVGATVIQPDTNLPDTETFARHFMHGQRYLQSRFGRTARVAWAADSFGHAAGMPEILAAAGMQYFAFTRPFPKVVPIAKPAFWWRAASGRGVLAYRPPVGWYGCEREEMPKRLDEFLKVAPEFGLHNFAVFFGLGNHGGGPTREQIAQIRRWGREHREVRLVFGGLHSFFDALRAEIEEKPKNFLPTHEGELNFCLRGCYSSVAKFKFLYRQAEAQIQRAERTESLVSGMAVSAMQHGRDAHATLTEAWHALLLNSFHDILPGSSIERVFDEQIQWLGGAIHAARPVEFDALNRLAAQVDTRVRKPAGDMPSGVAMLVFNPNPWRYVGPVELEAALDYRPIWKYSKKVDELPVRVLGPNRKPIAFQVVENEHHAMVELAWRKRVVINADIPAFGWNVFEIAYDESGQRGSAVTDSDLHMITNGVYTVTATPKALGIEIRRDDQLLLDVPGLSVFTMEDPWGSWGGMSEEPESIDISTVRHIWTITASRIMESGPLRQAMWVRMEAGNSRLDLTIRLTHGRDAVDVAARLFLDERSARVKLIMPAGEVAEYQVPGGTVTRGPCGEVPGGRWVRIMGSERKFGFASDSLYNFDTKDGALRATIARASRYADDVRTPADVEPWTAAVDSGELRFNFLLTTDVENLPRLADELEQPPVVILTSPHKGKLGRRGSLGSLSRESLRLLALKPAEDGSGLIVRVQETAGLKGGWIAIGKKKILLREIGAYQIATFRLRPSRGGWSVTTSHIPELR